MTISLCVPTRGRPGRFAQMVRSAKATATGDIEVIAWLDEDDPDRARYRPDEIVTYGAGPRPYIGGSLCTSGLWSKAWDLASGDIAMLAADDIMFRTPGWDERVRQAFEAVDDRIVMVYADDGTRRKAPVNPFVHRRWIEAAGFAPDDFQGWFADQWIWDLAAQLGRVTFLHDVKIRHVQRLGSDETYREGEAARLAVGGWEGMRERFYSGDQIAKRAALLGRLADVMDDQRLPGPEPTPAWLAESIALGIAH